jgi:hypothetical protein
MSAAKSRQEIADYVEQLKALACREACWSCDCFQGLLTQLSLDAEEPVDDLLEPLLCSREEMHGCMGCDPCPPGSCHAVYQKARNL